MPSPDIIDCPADQWTLVAVGAKGGRINRVLTNPNKYSWTYRATGSGEAAPISAAEGVAIFDDRTYLQLPLSGGIDVYIYPYDSDGSVRADILTEEIDVNIQDQTTPALIFPFNRITNTTTTTAPTVIGEYIVAVADTTGVIEQAIGIPGTFLIVFSATENRFYVGRVLEIIGLTLRMDRPFDSVLPSGSGVDITTTEMNVDGSVAPVTFGLRGPSVPGQIETRADVTRLMIGVLTDTIGDLSEFGDLPSLVNGVLVRHRNGFIQNIFLWKNNGELATLCYDLDNYLATNPQQGQNGFTARLTFAGQNKIGVVIRLGPGEDLEIIIQDDLSGLDRFGIIAEGHVVD